MIDIKNKIEINGIKLIVAIAISFMVWSNVQNVTLNAGGSLHAFNAYFSSPMMYVILLGFGYLSCYNNFTWKDYGKFLVSLSILCVITSFMYLDFFAFKEGYVTTDYMITSWFKLLFFDYGKWMIWIIVGGSALVKVLINKFGDNKNNWYIIRLISLIITLFLILVVLTVSIAFKVITNLYFYNNFNENLLYISFREGGFLQLIPGMMIFLVGVNMRWWINWKNIKCVILYSCLSFACFIVITSLRMMFEFPLIYWDITQQLQAIFLLMPFIMLSINSYKYVDFLFYGIIFIGFFHIAFNKIISVEFVLGLLLRVIFGLNTARRAVEFVNNNLFIALLYSLIKTYLLLIFCSWLSPNYFNLFKFKVEFLKPKIKKQSSVVKENNHILIAKIEN